MWTSGWEARARHATLSCRRLQARDPPAPALADELHRRPAVRVARLELDAGRRAVAGDADRLDGHVGRVGVLERGVHGRLARTAAAREAVDERAGEELAADLRLVAVARGGLEVLDGLGGEALVAAELARAVAVRRPGRLAAGEPGGGERGDGEGG